MRSLMFVPGHRERMIHRALGLGEFESSGLDVAILDLEDGVPPDSKDEARRIVASVLSSPSLPLRFVRIQRAMTHRHGFKDALTWLEVHGQSPDLVTDWNAIVAERRTELPPPDSAEGDPPPARRRRRRRRRRPRPA